MHKVIMITVLVTAFALMSPAAKAQEQSGMMDEDAPDMTMDGGGMMGGYGMYGQGMMRGGMGMYGMGMMRGGMGMMGMGPLWMLDLTPEQRTKINNIRDGLRKEHWEIMGKIMDEQAKLRDLYEADKLDVKKIGAAYDAIFGLRKQLIMARIEAMNRVRDVLTKEQLEQLKDMYRGRCGMYGGMMPGHMRGGMTGK